MNRCRSLLSVTANGDACASETYLYLKVRDMYMYSETYSDFTHYRGTPNQYEIQAVIDVDLIPIECLPFDRELCELSGPPNSV